MTLPETKYERRKLWLYVAEALFLVGVVLVIVNWDYLSSTFIDTDQCVLPESEIVGIDISHYQGRVRWDDLCFGFKKQTRVLNAYEYDTLRPVDFVIAKATEGTYWRDQMYPRNKIACEEHRIPFAAYHFFKPDVPPLAQAQSFMEYADLKEGNMLPVVDVEERGSLPVLEFQANVMKFCEALKAEYGKMPMIYCDLHFYNSYFNNGQFSEYKFWIAAHSRKNLHLNHQLWQASSSARVKGIRGKVDMDVFNGDKEKFQEEMFI